MNRSGTILSAQNVSVSYRIPTRRYGSPKEMVLSRLKGEKNPVVEFAALEQVSIELKAGECVGLIGHNGCGKSTLLKVIAGILSTKAGKVTYEGRLTSLIELGAGFDPELPARDNIFLACTLMGIAKREINENLQRIIEFAELDRFLDFPLKNYSSGMYARLGFSCATIINPDIILVDEVLAVGDEAFQAKCLRRILELKENGKGIILVTHDMGAVQRFCDRVYVLDHGRLVYQGPNLEGIAAYRRYQGLPTEAPAADGPL